MRPRHALTAALAAVVVVALGSLAGATRIDGAGHGGRPLTADLTGAAEVPPADPDGTGSALVTVNIGQREVCWDLSVSDIEPATAAHIHEAPAGANGPVVVPLSPPTDGSSSGCADVDRALAKDILRHPEEYYVNVHNAEFPNGAVRGQLSR